MTFKLGIYFQRLASIIFDLGFKIWGFGDVVPNLIRFVSDSELIIVKLVVIHRTWLLTTGINTG